MELVKAIRKAWEWKSQPATALTDGSYKAIIGGCSILEPTLSLFSPNMLAQSSAFGSLTLRVFYYIKWQIRLGDTWGLLILSSIASRHQSFQSRERHDTIRSIVSSLVDEGGELMSDNEQITPLQTSGEDYTDRNWEPDPIDAGSGKYPSSCFRIWLTDRPFLDFRTNKPSDVVSTLVSIYDSKDLFVKELQSLLAQRLLLVRDGNYEKEVCHLVYKMLRLLTQRHTED